ncbi:MAG: hypothetical protein AAF957_04605 [Planctomycetota bacterium]
MRILLQDLTDRGAPGLGRPGSISLLRVATGVGLTRFGHEPVETVDDDPELALVDALDVPTEDALEVVEGHCDRSLPVVVRVHGGWRTGDAAPATGHPSDASVEEQQRRTQRLLDLGDRLLVSSRSHLVRLAGHHTIDTSRVKLLAPPHPGFAPARVRGRRRGQAGHVVLALGDGDLDVLQHALPATVRITRPAAAPHDVAEVDAFRVAVADADVVALVGGEIWSDRVLLQSSVDLGRPVVAASGPVTGEELARPGVVALAMDATEYEWADAVDSALSSNTRAALARDDRAQRSTALAERMRRLTAILFESAASAGDCSDRRAA